MKTLFPSVPIQCFFSKYFLKVYLPQSTMYLPSQKLTSLTWKQFETTPKKERRHHHHHQVIKSSSPRQPFFPRGFGPSPFVSGAAGNPQPPSWDGGGLLSITSRKAQASLPYWSGWQGFQSSHGMRSCVPSDGQMDGKVTSWDKHVMFRCHDFFGCPGKKKGKENSHFFLNECVYNHDSLASKNWCNNKRPDVTKHDFPVRYIHSHHCF